MFYYLCMVMNDFSLKINQLREFLEGPQKRVAIVSHTNPDGDAVGSSLAWAQAVRSYGHQVSCLVPNRFPGFLEWMDGIGEVVVAKEQEELAMSLVREAELIFILDLNKIDRLDGITDALADNTSAPRILIDHHLMPPDEYTLQFSYPELCSTAYVVYRIIEEIKGVDIITKSMAENLYTGIMTDTGNFAFSFLTPDLMRAVAVLLERGLEIPKVHTAVYDAYSSSRMRLLGFSLCHKMELFHNNKAAYLSLTEKEMRRFHFQLGDSEGFVNYPLSIQGVKMSAIFIETHRFIRVSLRSRGDEVDVNVFARRYFQGGGHKNAAGGKSFVSMEETIELYRTAAAEYIAECERQSRQEASEESAS